MPSFNAAAERERALANGTPGWLYDAARIRDRAWRGGFRIKRFRLTHEQARELEQITGEEPRRLFGRPVVLK